MRKIQADKKNRDKSGWASILFEAVCWISSSQLYFVSLSIIATWNAILCSGFLVPLFFFFCTYWPLTHNWEWSLINSQINTCALSGRDEHLNGFGGSFLQQPGFPIGLFTSITPRNDATCSVGSPPLWGTIGKWEVCVVSGTWEFSHMSKIRKFHLAGETHSARALVCVWRVGVELEFSWRWHIASC